MDILLEIATFLSLRDLLRMQQVCTFWNWMVKSDLGIQRRLLLAPPKESIGQASGGQFRWNPWFDPIFKRSLFIIPFEPPLPILRDRSDTRGAALALGKDASAKRMFISDPPLKKLTILDHQASWWKLIATSWDKRDPFQAWGEDKRRAVAASLKQLENPTTFTLEVTDDDGIRIGRLLKWLEDNSALH
jgi:hypothetical protein